MSDFDIDDIPSFVDENGSDNSPTPESREVLLIQQGIFDYNMNTTVAGVAEDKAMDEAVRYFQALIVAAQKALLDRLEAKQSVLPLNCGHDSDECRCERFYVVSIEAIEAERQQLGKESSDE